MERYQQLLYEQQLRMHHQIGNNALYGNGHLVRNSPVRTSLGPSPSPLNRTFPPPNQLPIMRRSYSLNAEQVKAARKGNGGAVGLGGLTSPKRVSFSTLPSPPAHPMSPSRVHAASPVIRPAGGIFPGGPSRLPLSANRVAPNGASNKVAPLTNGFARQKRPVSSDSVFFSKPLPPVPEARTWLLGGGRRSAPVAPESESGSEAGEIQRIMYSSGRSGASGTPSYVSFRGEYLDGVACSARAAASILHARAYTPS